MNDNAQNSRDTNSIRNNSWQALARTYVCVRISNLTISVLLPFCWWRSTSLTLLTIFAAWIMAAMTCIVARLKRATNKKKISTDVRHPANHMHVVRHECSSKRFNGSFPAWLLTVSALYKCSWIRVHNFQSRFVSTIANNWRRNTKPIERVQMTEVYSHHTLPPLQCTCDAYGVQKSLRRIWKNKLKCKKKNDFFRSSMTFSIRPVKNE